MVEAVYELCGIAPESLIDDAELSDLDIDSLDLIEIGVIIEQRYGVQANSDDLSDVTTFGGAVEMFDRVITAQTFL